MALPSFAREAIEINLRRIPWLLVAAMALALWPLAAFWRDPEMAWLRTTLLVDVASASLFLALNGPVRRLPPESFWRPAYVWTAVVLALGYMDGYYFLVARSFGQNPSYILGTIMAATIFLLPPVWFLPLLLANHLVYCVLLFGQSDGDGQLLPVLIQNTTGAVVAGLVAFLLFGAQREAYGQRQALAVANRFLRRRNEQLNDLMAITAHDLRGPLLGMRDLLRLARQAPDPGKRGQILDRVMDACVDLVGLVTRLLRAHEAEERAEQALLLAPCDLRDVVQKAVDRVRPRAETRSIVLDIRLPGTPAIVRIDPVAMGQVLDNLLFNAVRFSPDRGLVGVHLLHEDGFWRCEVADSGPGIAPEERATLFQKFHRGTTAAAAEEEGSGLGLFIAATLMRAMGGDVEHRPREGNGAIFRLTFDMPEVDRFR
ncbi:sensor histidine kinase [Reyranella sp.]|uniref:sensor histidine kinase n=1 Tax=Reyranella sp. TaxID=1929291 RepID=UPI003BAD1630